MKKLLNPFRYLAGGRALAWGLVVLILTSIFSWQTGVVARGNMSIGYADGYVSLLAATLRMLVLWLVFATLLYAAGMLLSRSKIRAVDIYGTNLFASIPLTVGMLLTALPTMRRLEAQLMEHLADPAALAAALWTPTRLIILGALLVVMVWYFWWSYSAFAVSANLKSVRAVVAYIVCFVAAQILYGPISHWFAGMGIC